ncbi:MAG TPA: hypothetical protein VLI94_01015 [Solirubrobacterales bacterium]|nr:hypothetical protein [Solirubrobacterales bacterium]
MNDDLTPINARPKRRQPEALEDLSLALRDRLIWPLEDRFVTLSRQGRAAVTGGAVVLALGIGIGSYALVSSDGSEPQTVAPVAAAVEPAPQPVTPQPAPEPDPTLQGATPVFKAPDTGGKPSQVAGSKAVADKAPAGSTASNTGNAATDTISSDPAASANGAGATASTSAPTVDGPPAGPAAVAVARKFATAFVVYETGGEKAEVRKAFAATATPELTEALMERPPRQPAGVEVPKAKVLNVVPAPSHDRIYPISVSLLRVGSTSELRLEMERWESKQWRVTNVLG